MNRCFRPLIPLLLLTVAIPFGFSQSAELPKATAAEPFVNSLGMKFVPAPGTSVLFCIWEIRVRDYTAFATAKPGQDASWQKVTSGTLPVSEGPDYPVVFVNWTSAKAFCEWLTQKERDAGRLGPGLEYRLPTDAEWSTAVGLSEKGRTPKEKDKQLKTVFPWGSAWPPPSGAGNYAGEESRAGDTSGTWKCIPGYKDDYPRTAPVGSFQPNAFGIYDLSGNVWEWCEDFYNGQSGTRVIRGGSWVSSEADLLWSCRRLSVQPFLRGDCTGFRVVLADVSVR